MHSVRRTLVKSPPELWAEVSDPEALARHLGAFGEIRITRLDPEATVAWEGDRVRGTVDLASSGWGTKVTITAEQVEAPEQAAEPARPEPVQPEPEPAPQPTAIATPAPPRRSLWSRMFGRSEPAPTPTPTPAVVVPEAEAVTVEIAAVEPDASPAAEPAAEPAAVLDGMLDALGAAHHRPFTR